MRRPLTLLLGFGAALVCSQAVRVQRINPPVRGDLTAPPPIQEVLREGLLRLPFEPNAMALVQRPRAVLLAHPARRGGRAPSAELLGLDGLRLGSRDRRSEAS